MPPQVIIMGGQAPPAEPKKKSGVGFATGVMVGIAGAFVGVAAFHVIRAYKQKRVAQMAEASAAAPPKQVENQRSTPLDYYLPRSRPTFGEG